MLKQTRASYFSNFKNAQYCALSGDPIPDYIKNGDEVYIIDTAKRCLYDADSGTLIEQPSSGGGGSSDWVNASVTFINNTPENGEYFVDTPFGVIPIEEQETIVLPLKKEDDSIFYLSLKDIIDVESSVTPSVTGDITIEENGFEIQGDGSIAFSSLAPTEISGVPPLELEDALARPLRKLVQHGKVDVSGTDITCNNGTLKFGATGKNKLRPMTTSRTQSGITVSGFGDGRMTITGTATEDVQFQIWNFDATTDTYALILKEDIDGSLSTWWVSISGVAPIYSGHIGYYTFASAGTFYIRINVKSGVTVNETIYPMVAKTATEIPYEPYTEGIYTDGTPEEIRLTGINQFDKTTAVVGYIDDADGELKGTQAGSAYRSTDFVSVVGGQSYYIKTEQVASLWGAWYDENKEYISGQTAYANVVITAPNNAKYVRLTIESNGNGNVDTFAINYPSTDTDYHPAHIQTATAENLFAVDDIEDTQDIVTGEVIHRTEAIVSDGTTPSGRYVGTVGEGNVIVRVREDKYEGEVVSFEAEEEFPLNKLVVNLSPKQDLHGYDSPWPEGGGKNKFNIDDATSSDFSISGETVTNTNVDSRASFMLSWQVFNNNTLVTYTIATPVSGKVTATLTINDPCTRMVIKHNGSTRDLVINFPWTQTGTWAISMNVISDDPTTVGGLVLSNIQVESGSTATAWTPYSNICPISGHTGVDVTRTGKNLIKPTGYGGIFYSASIGQSLAIEKQITAIQTNDGYDVVVPQSWEGKVFATDVLPVGNYHLHIKTDSSNARIACFTTDADYVVTRVIGYLASSGIYDANVTFTEKRRIAIFVASSPAQTINVHDFQVELGSSFSEYQPYQGEEVSVTFPSVNVWDEEVELGAISSSTGENTPNNNRLRSKNYIPVKSGESYYFKSPANIEKFMYDADKNYLGLLPGDGDAKNVVRTIPSGCSYIRLGIYTIYGTTYNNDISINYPSFETGYHAHTEPMTVYGAQPDIVGGEMPITLAEVDCDDIDFTLYLSNVGRWAYDFPGIKQNTDGANLIGLRSEVYREVSSNSYNNVTGTMYLQLNSNRVHICTGDENIRPTGKLVFLLATPTETTITPTPVSTLKGDNNMWSNAGAVTAYVPTGDVVEQVEKQKLSTAEGDNTITVTAEVEDIVFDVVYRKNNSGGETLPDARGVYF